MRAISRYSSSFKKTVRRFDALGHSVQFTSYSRRSVFCQRRQVHRVPSAQPWQQ